MKRILGQSLALVAIVAFGSVFTPACAGDDASIFVNHALAPPTSRQGGVCQYSSDPTQPFLSQGTLDVGVRDSYTVNLLVGNQLIQRGDPLSTRVEANRVHLDGAVVRVTDGNGVSIADFTSVTSGFVDAASGNTPAYGIAAVTALDATTVTKAVAQLKVAVGAPKLVIANMKVFGKTLGGIDVQSAEWSFPIRVCDTCLIDFSTGDDPAIAGVDCRFTGTATGSTLITQQAPCAKGEDESTPCQLCRDRPACNP